MFAEDLGEEDAAADAPDGGIRAAGGDVRQFVVTLASTLNGFRADNIVLSPRGGDTWRVACQIAQGKPSLAEFDAARAKATQVRADPEDSNREASFLNTIRRSCEGAAGREASGPQLVAPWAMLM